MKERLKHELSLIYNTKEQSQNGKRLTCLDMTRGIAIILVVLGHSGFVGNSCNIWLSTFHLPTFFLLSGVLLQRKKEEYRPLPQLLLQKAKGVLIPYLWFSIGSLCLDFLQILLGNFTWNTLWEHLIQTISFQGYSVLWFLPVLYLAEILLLLLQKACRRFLRQEAIRIIFCTTIITVCSVGSYYGYRSLCNHGIPNFVLLMLRIPVKALISSSFICYGYLFGYAFFGIFKRIHKWYAFLSGAILFITNILCVPHVSLMDLNFLNLPNPWVYLALGTTGGFGCLLLCMSLPNIPLLTFYGQNSLIIMSTHMNFYVMYFSMLFNLFLIPRLPGANDTTYAIFSIVGTLLLSIPVILVIRIFFPFVLGQTKKQTTTTNTRAAA